MSEQFFPDSQRFPGHPLRLRELSLLPIHATEIIQRSGRVRIVVAEEPPPNRQRFPVHSFRLGHLVLGYKRQTQFVERRSRFRTFWTELLPPDRQRCAIHFFSPIKIPDLPGGRGLRGGPGLSGRRAAGPEGAVIRARRRRTAAGGADGGPLPLHADTGRRAAGRGAVPVPGHRSDAAPARRGNAGGGRARFPAGPAADPQYLTCPPACVIIHYSE